MILPIIHQAWLPVRETSPHLSLTILELIHQGKFILAAHLSTGYVSEVTL